MKFILSYGFKFVIVSIYLLGFCSNSYAGGIGDSIRMECPEQYARYEQAVQDFAIRMQDNVEAYGCGVVSAYGVFAAKDMGRINQWEDDDQSFQSVSDVFILADRYQLDISTTPVLFDALQSMISNGGEQIYSKIDQLLAYATPKQRRLINRKPERILYLVWALQIKPDESSRGIFQEARRLKRMFSLEKLPVALILNGQISMLYPHMTVKKHLDLIRYVFGSYSSSFMMNVVSNPLALPNLVYLLPPQANDIKGAQGLTDRDLKQLQKNYVDSIQKIIQSFELASVGFGAAVDATSVLAPYIQQALIDAPERSIVSYLSAQIHSPVFNQYINQEGCLPEGFSKVVASFFTFLAPKKKDDQQEMVPIDYLQNNLAMIANWYDDDQNMKAWVKDNNNMPDNFIQNMAVLPYYYKQSSPRSRKYMSELFQSLPSDMNTNASFISALYQGTDYFNSLADAADADMLIVANEDARDESAPKYRYILTTPFPSQSDRSVFDRFTYNGSGLAMIPILNSYTVDDLSTHEFTNKEKILSKLGDADTALDILAIAAVPLTGGASLLVVGGRMMAKQAVKKGWKYAMKGGYRYVRKSAARNIRRTSMRLTGREGKKAFVREGKELFGLATKRGRPSKYANGQAKMAKWLNKSDDNFGLIQGSILMSSLGLAAYCSKYAGSSSHPMVRKLCGAEPDAQPVNQCKNFNMRSL